MKPEEKAQEMTEDVREIHQISIQSGLRRRLEWLKNFRLRTGHRGPSNAQKSERTYLSLFCFHSLATMPETIILGCRFVSQMQKEIRGGLSVHKTWSLFSPWPRHHLQCCVSIINKLKKLKALAKSQ